MMNTPKTTAERIILIAGLWLTACSDPGADLSGGPVGPSTGTLVVSTSTVGEDPDQDGYQLTVDNANSRDLDLTGTTELDLTSGRHTLRLLGVADQCTVTPGTTVEVDIPSGSRTSATFDVSCAATLTGHVWGKVLGEGVGCLRGAVVEIVAGPGVGRKSSQPDPPPCDPWSEEGFQFDELPLGGTVTLRATAPGYQPKDSVVVVSNDGIAVVFILSPDGTPTGSIQVSVHTAGGPLDPDGYSIVLDNGFSGSAAPVNGQVLLADLAPGDHRVRLEGAADNCWQSETRGGVDNAPWSAFPLPPVVSVAPGHTASVTFDLVCVEPGEAAIDIQVEQTGDPFSYYTTLILSRSDGLTRSVQPGVLHGLTKGTYQLWLTGGTPFHIQCAVAAPNPRTVDLESETVVGTVFQLRCINE